MASEGFVPNNAIEKAVDPVVADIIEPMTESDSLRLTELEIVVERGWKASLDAAIALREIREKRLYRSTYRTFEDYLRARWEMSKSHGHDHINWAIVNENLKSLASTSPRNVWQARALARFEPEVQKDIWLEAIRTSETEKREITGKLIKEIAKNFESAAQEADERRAERVNTATARDAITGYELADPFEHLALLPAASADLLIISDLETPKDPVDRLEGLLSSALTVMKPDCQAFVFLPGGDVRPYLDKAEALGFEIGEFITWSNDAAVQRLDWSATVTGAMILHLRRGGARLASTLDSVIDCRDDDQKCNATRRPLELMKALIIAATRAGDRVLDLTAGIGASVLACRASGRDCIAVESDAEVHAAGVKRIQEVVAHEKEAA